ncbi:MAG: Ig-like domain-containing protein, partial [Desulfuromonadales bacterium]|nr:Ig-like domain-containing protein [Desulfuromonadales bacterium]
MPYTGMLLRRVDPGQKGPFIVSPLTTILANNVTPDELIALLDNSGLPGLQRDGLFRDPMRGLVAAGGEIDQQALRLLQSNLAAGVYLMFLDIPKFIDQVNPYETNFPYFADAVSMVQDTLDEQLLQQFLAEVSPEFSLGDRLATSIRLCQLTVSELERALAVGQAVSGDLLAGILADTIAVALDVAKEVYFARTGEKVNRLPAALDDMVSADEGGAVVTGNLLANDSPGDAPVQVTAAGQGGMAIPLGAGYTTAAGGVLTLETNGAFAYQPPPLGEVPREGLSEQFSYMLADEDGDTSSTVFTVQVRDSNRLPAALDDMVSADEGGAVVTGNLLA